MMHPALILINRDTNNPAPPPTSAALPTDNHNVMSNGVQHEKNMPNELHCLSGDLGWEIPAKFM